MARDKFLRIVDRGSENLEHVTARKRNCYEDLPEMRKISAKKT